MPSKVMPATAPPLGFPVHHPTTTMTNTGGSSSNNSGKKAIAVIENCDADSSAAAAEAALSARLKRKERLKKGHKRQQKQQQQQQQQQQKPPKEKGTPQPLQQDSAGFPTTAAGAATPAIARENKEKKKKKKRKKKEEGGSASEPKKIVSAFLPDDFGVPNSDDENNGRSSPTITATATASPNNNKSNIITTGEGILPAKADGWFEPMDIVVTPQSTRTPTVSADQHMICEPSSEQSPAEQSAEFPGVVFAQNAKNSRTTSSSSRRPIKSTSASSSASAPAAIGGSPTSKVTLVKIKTTPKNRLEPPPAVVSPTPSPPTSPPPTNARRERLLRYNTATQQHLQYQQRIGSGGDGKLDENTDAVKNRDSRSPIDACASLPSLGTSASTLGKPIAAASSGGIPSSYLTTIDAAFGPDADIYADVLQIDRHTATHREIRIAYFRRGREVLASGGGGPAGSDYPSSHPTAQRSMAPMAIASHSISGAVSPEAKLRFQSVSMAYEILTNSAWKAQYDADVDADDGNGPLDSTGETLSTRGRHPTRTLNNTSTKTLHATNTSTASSKTSATSTTSTTASSTTLSSSSSSSPSTDKADDTTMEQKDEHDFPDDASAVKPQTKNTPTAPSSPQLTRSPRSPTMSLLRTGRSSSLGATKRPRSGNAVRWNEEVEELVFDDEDDARAALFSSSSSSSEEDDDDDEDDSDFDDDGEETDANDKDDHNKMETESSGDGGSVSVAANSADFNSSSGGAGPKKKRTPRGTRASKTVGVGGNTRRTRRRGHKRIVVEDDHLQTHLENLDKEAERHFVAGFLDDLESSFEDILSLSSFGSPKGKGAGTAKHVDGPPIPDFDGMEEDREESCKESLDDGGARGDAQEEEAQEGLLTKSSTTNDINSTPSEATPPSDDDDAKNNSDNHCFHSNKIAAANFQYMIDHDDREHAHDTDVAFEGEPSRTTNHPPPHNQDPTPNAAAIAVAASAVVIEPDSPPREEKGTQIRKDQPEIPHSPNHEAKQRSVNVSLFPNSLPQKENHESPPTAILQPPQESGAGGTHRNKSKNSPVLSKKKKRSKTGFVAPADIVFENNSKDQEDNMSASATSDTISTISASVVEKHLKPLLVQPPEPRQTPPPSTPPSTNRRRGNSLLTKMEDDDDASASMEELALTPCSRRSQESPIVMSIEYNDNLACVTCCGAGCRGGASPSPSQSSSVNMSRPSSSRSLLNSEPISGSGSRSTVSEGLELSSLNTPTRSGSQPVAPADEVPGFHLLLFTYLNSLAKDLTQLGVYLHQWMDTIMVSEQDMEGMLAIIRTEIQRSTAGDDDIMTKGGAGGTAGGESKKSRVEE